MGLDAVELVMAVEEGFGLSIDDRDAEKIITVGQLWDYICERVTFVPPQVCATAAAFYRLRRAMVSEAVVSRAGFRPATSLTDMLPTRNRRAEWRQLSDSAAVKLPALELPPVLEQIQMWLIIWLPMSAAVLLAMNDHVMAAIFSMLVGMLLTAGLLQVLVRPWRTRLNPAWATAGGLARTVVGLNPDAWDAPATESREIAWERLRAIIVETLGASADLVRPEASFIGDLGLD